MGKISVSFVSGSVAVWVTPDMAQRLTHPMVTFLNNGDIMLSNDGKVKRTWDYQYPDRPRIQIIEGKWKGPAPTREFSRTEALTCVSKEAGKILLEMPAKRKPPVHRARKNPPQKYPPAIPSSRKPAPAPIARLPAPGTASELKFDVAVVGASRSDRIKLSVETLNTFKDEFGDNFVLKIGEDGKVKATLLMEF